MSEPLEVLNKHLEKCGFVRNGAMCWYARNDSLHDPTELKRFSHAFLPLCLEDDADWPCDAVLMARLLLAAQERVAALEGALRSARTAMYGLISERVVTGEPGDWMGFEAAVNREFDALAALPAEPLDPEPKP